MKSLAAIAAFCSTTALVLTAAPAQADQYDFISALDNQGVTYTDILGMIEVGKAICHTMRNGGVLGSVNSALASRGWNSPAERGIIIVSAANTMCPDVWPTLNAQVQPPSAAAPVVAY